MNETERTRTLAALTDCEPAEARQALDILRQRFPEYLPRVWRELAGSGALAAGAAIPMLSEEDFLTDVGNPPPMLIEGLLPDRSLFLLSGKPKAGKSFLALDMAYAVRTGADVFGKYKVNRPGPVIYLGMEDGKYEIANRLLARGRRKEREQGEKPEAGSRKSDENDGEPIQNPKCKTQNGAGLMVCSERFVLSDPERMEMLRAQIEPLNPSLLIVDTAAEALGIRDWLNRGEIVEKVGALRDFSRQVCAVLLVSHNRKSEGDAGDEIAGSNAFTGAVDGWISAYKAEALPSGNRRLYLRTEGRGGVRGELAVEMDTKTLHFTALSAEEAGRGKEDAAKDEMAAKIARAIADCGGKATVKQISEMLEWPYSTIGRHVRQLLASGFLLDTGERLATTGGGPEVTVFRVA